MVVPLHLGKFDPWVGKIPWRRVWQPTPVFLPEESHGQRSLASYSPWGSKKVRTEWLSTQIHMHSLFQKRLNSPFNECSFYLNLESGSPYLKRGENPGLIFKGEQWVFIGLNMTSFNDVKPRLLPDPYTEGFLGHFHSPDIITWWLWSHQAIQHKGKFCLLRQNSGICSLVIIVP